MRILVTNDDGLHAEGIQRLCEALRPVAELVIVVPDRQRSGFSHSITELQPLRLIETRFLDGTKAYISNGTPADCVALAACELSDGGIDLAISGINHGWNVGVDVYYSGTVMAAAEAALLSLPALAVSAEGRGKEPTRFATAAWFVKSLVQKAVHRSLPEGTFLNVNVPSLPRNAIKGVKVAPLSLSMLRDRFDKRSDPYGATYYWRGGVTPYRRTQRGGMEHASPPGTDTHAVSEGFISVTPLRLNLTDEAALETVRSWELGKDMGFGGEGAPGA